VIVPTPTSPPAPVVVPPPPAIEPDPDTVVAAPGTGGTPLTP
jgi:hypothetical protein